MADGLRRREAEALGRLAETIASLLLRLKGYRILERRFRCHAGEIDLIARRGALLVFVEVKARPDLASGFDAIGRKSRQRILAAADVWVARRPREADCARRFDLVVVRPRRLPIHIRGAFTGDDL